LVAAELSRRGFIATTFTGNVPHYDIVASDEAGRHVSVQVKASQKGSWQFDISCFAELSFRDRRQIIGKAKPCPVVRLVVVFVAIGERGGDRFYILTWEKLRALLIRHHKGVLEKCGGLRPKRWDSPHCAIKEQALLSYRDKWETIEESLR
jgi:hypothetical protein